MLNSSAMSEPTDANVLPNGSFESIRGLHIVTYLLSPEDAKMIVDRAANAGMNTLIIGVAWNGSTQLKSMPWVPQGKAWTSDQLLDFAEYARSKGMQVIPHVPLLTNADKLLLGAHDELLYNLSTYDPSNEKVYELVLPILEEIVALLKPKAIHVGHDEVWGWKNVDFEKDRLREGESILPADLYLGHILRIHEYLDQRNVEMWMWGDMLISYEEFPNMTGDGALHRGIEKFGYGASLRKKIPRGIVICDWHYRDKQFEFPSLATFRREGFKVVGTTWQQEDTVRNFTRYAAENGGTGMIASTWYFVQRRDWEVVNRVIDYSGKIYSDYFGG